MKYNNDFSSIRYIKSIDNIDGLMEFKGLDKEIDELRTNLNNLLFLNIIKKSVIPVELKIIDDFIMKINKIKNKSIGCDNYIDYSDLNYNAILNP